MMIRSWDNPDTALVFDAWLRKLRHTSPWSRTPAHWFYAAQRTLINAILLHREVEVSIGCHPNNPDQVFGFAVGEPENRVLHWVYTKGAGSDLFRRARVATRLVQHLMHCRDTSEPTDGRGIVATAETPELRLLLPAVRVDYYALMERAR